MNFKFKRVVALATVLFLMVNTLAYSAPELLLGSRLDRPEAIRLPLEVQVPADLGSVDEIYQAPQSDLVFFHIQDAHGNLEAQRNIRSLTRHLSERYGVPLIFLEGSHGSLQPELFHFFKDHKLNLKVARHLMKQGEFSGAEMFLLEESTKVRAPSPKGTAWNLAPGTWSESIHAFGIEDVPTYRRDLDSFREVLGQAEIAQRFLEKVEGKTRQLENRFLSRDLRNFIREWRKYHQDQASLLHYSEILYRQALDVLKWDLEEARNQGEYPGLLRVLKLKDLEKEMNPEKAKEEKEKLILFLQEKKMKKEILNRLANLDKEKWPRFLLERLYQNMGEGFDLGPYPHFSRYAQYLIFRSEIESRGLFKEMDTLADKLFAALAKTREEKSLVELAKGTSELKKFFSLEITREEYRQILEKKEIVKPSRLVQKIEALQDPRKSKDIRFLPGSPPPEAEILDTKSEAAADSLFNTALRFYRLAEEREGRFLETALSVMREKKARRAIMVTGGFHSEGLKEKFKQQGFSYIEISPRMSDASQGRDVYLEAMLGRDQIRKSQIANVGQLMPLGLQERMGALVEKRKQLTQSLVQSLALEGGSLMRTATFPTAQAASFGQSSGRRNPERPSKDEPVEGASAAGPLPAALRLDLKSGASLGATNRKMLRELVPLIPGDTVGPQKPLTEADIEARVERYLADFEFLVSKGITIDQMRESPDILKHNPQLKWEFLTTEGETEDKGVTYTNLNIPKDKVRQNPSLLALGFDNLSKTWRYLTTSGETKDKGVTYTNLNIPEDKVRQHPTLLTLGFDNLSKTWRYLTTSGETKDKGVTYTNLNIPEDKVRQYPTLLALGFDNLSKTWRYLTTSGETKDKGVTYTNLNIPEEKVRQNPNLLALGFDNLSKTWSYLTASGETKDKGVRYANLNLPEDKVRQHPNLLWLGFENLSDTDAFLTTQARIDQSYIRDHPLILTSALDIGKKPYTGLRMRTAYFLTKGISYTGKPYLLKAGPSVLGGVKINVDDISSFNRDQWMPRESAFRAMEGEIRKLAGKSLNRILFRRDMRRLRVLSDDYLYFGAEGAKAVIERDILGHIDHIVSIHLTAAGLDKEKEEIRKDLTSAALAHAASFGQSSGRPKREPDDRVEGASMGSEAIPFHRVARTGGENAEEAVFRAALEDSDSALENERLLRQYLLSDQEMYRQWFEGARSLKERMKIAGKFRANLITILWQYVLTALYRLTRWQKLEIHYRWLKIYRSLVKLLWYADLEMAVKFLVAGVHFSDRYGFYQAGPVNQTQRPSEEYRVHALANYSDKQFAAKLLVAVDEFLSRNFRVASTVRMNHDARTTLAVSMQIQKMGIGNTVATTFQMKDSNMKWVVLPLYYEGNLMKHDEVPDEDSALYHTGERLQLLDRLISHELGETFLQFFNEDRFNLPVDLARIQTFLGKYPDLNQTINLADYQTEQDRALLPIKIAGVIYKKRTNLLADFNQGRSFYNPSEIRKEFLTAYSFEAPSEFLIESLSLYWLDQEFLRESDRRMFDLIDALADWEILAELPKTMKAEPSKGISRSDAASAAGSLPAGLESSSLGVPLAPDGQRSALRSSERPVPSGVSKSPDFNRLDLKPGASLGAEAWIKAIEEKLDEINYPDRHDEVLHVYENYLQDLLTYLIQLPSYPKPAAWVDKNLSFPNDQELALIGDGLRAYWNKREWDSAWGRLNQHFAVLNTAFIEPASMAETTENRIRLLLGGSIDDQLLGLWMKGVTLGLHLRHFGGHIEDVEGVDRALDNEFLAETVRRYIPLLLYRLEHPRADIETLGYTREVYEDLLLWGFSVMIDPGNHIIRRKADQKGKFVSIVEADPHRTIPEYMLGTPGRPGMFSGLKRLDENGKPTEIPITLPEIKDLLAQILAREPDEWQRKGHRSPWRVATHRAWELLYFWSKKVESGERNFRDPAFMLTILPEEIWKAVDHPYRHTDYDFKFLGFGRIDHYDYAKEVFFTWPEFITLFPGLESRVESRTLANQRGENHAAGTETTQAGASLGEKNWWGPLPSEFLDLQNKGGGIPARPLAQIRNELVHVRQRLEGILPDFREARKESLMRDLHEMVKIALGFGLGILGGGIAGTILSHPGLATAIFVGSVFGGIFWYTKNTRSSDQQYQGLKKKVGALTERREEILDELFHRFGLPFDDASRQEWIWERVMSLAFRMAQGKNEALLLKGPPFLRRIQKLNQPAERYRASTFDWEKQWLLERSFGDIQRAQEDFLLDTADFIEVASKGEDVERKFELSGNMNADLTRLGSAMDRLESVASAAKSLGGESRNGVSEGVFSAARLDRQYQLLPPAKRLQLTRTLTFQPSLLSPLIGREGHAHHAIVNNNMITPPEASFMRTGTEGESQSDTIEAPNMISENRNNEPDNLSLRYGSSIGTSVARDAEGVKINNHIFYDGLVINSTPSRGIDIETQYGNLGAWHSERGAATQAAAQSLGRFARYLPHVKILGAAFLLGSPVLLEKFNLAGRDFIYFMFQGTIMMSLFSFYYWAVRFASNDDLARKEASPFLKTVLTASLALTILWPFNALLHEWGHFLAAKIWEPAAYMIVPAWQKMIIALGFIYIAAGATLKLMDNHRRKIKGQGLLWFDQGKKFGFLALGLSALTITLLAFGLYSESLAKNSLLETVLGRHPWLEQLKSIIYTANPEDQLVPSFGAGGTLGGFTALNAVWGPPALTMEKLLSVPLIKHTIYLVPNLAGAIFSLALFRYAKARSLFLQMIAFGLASYATFGGEVVDYIQAGYPFLEGFFIMLGVWWLAWETANILAGLYKFLRPNRAPPAKSAARDDHTLKNSRIFLLPLILIPLHQFLTGPDSFYKNFSTVFKYNSKFSPWLAQTFHIAPYQAIAVISVYLISRFAIYPLYHRYSRGRQKTSGAEGVREEDLIKRHWQDFWDQRSWRDSFGFRKSEGAFKDSYPREVRDFIIGHLRDLPRAGKASEIGDIGAGGDLWLARQIKSEFPETKVYAVDIVDVNPATLKGANEINYRKASADQTGFEDGFFRAVVAAFSLEYIPDIEKAAKELHRILASEGQALVVLHRLDSPNVRELMRILSEYRQARARGTVRPSGSHSMAYLEAAIAALEPLEQNLKRFPTQVEVQRFFEEQGFKAEVQLLSSKGEPLGYGVSLQKASTSASALSTAQSLGDFEAQLKEVGNKGEADHRQVVTTSLEGEGDRELAWKEWEPERKLLRPAILSALVTVILDETAKWMVNHFVSVGGLFSFNTPRWEMDEKLSFLPMGVSIAKISFQDPVIIFSLPLLMFFPSIFGFLIYGFYQVRKASSKDYSWKYPAGLGLFLGAGLSQLGGAILHGEVLDWLMIKSPGGLSVLNLADALCALGVGLVLKELIGFLFLLAKPRNPKKEMVFASVSLLLSLTLPWFGFHLLLSGVKLGFGIQSLGFVVAALGVVLFFETVPLVKRLFSQRRKAEAKKPDTAEATPGLTWPGVLNTQPLAGSPTVNPTLLWTSNPTRYEALEQKGLDRRLIPPDTSLADLGNGIANALFKTEIKVKRREFFWPNMRFEPRLWLGDLADTLRQGDEIYVEKNSLIPKVSGRAGYEGFLYKSVAHSSFDVSKIAIGDRVQFISTDDLRKGIEEGLISRLASYRTKMADIRQGDILSKEDAAHLLRLLLRGNIFTEARYLSTPNQSRETVFTVTGDRKSNLDKDVDSILAGLANNHHTGSFEFWQGQEEGGKLYLRIIPVGQSLGRQKTGSSDKDASLGGGLQAQSLGAVDFAEALRQNFFEGSDESPDAPSEFEQGASLGGMEEKITGALEEGQKDFDAVKDDFLAILEAYLKVIEHLPRYQRRNPFEKEVYKWITKDDLLANIRSNITGPVSMLRGTERVPDETEIRHQLSNIQDARFKLLVVKHILHLDRWGLEEEIAHLRQRFRHAESTPFFQKRVREALTGIGESVDGTSYLEKKMPLVNAYLTVLAKKHVPIKAVDAFIENAIIESRDESPTPKAFERFLPVIVTLKGQFYEVAEFLRDELMSGIDYSENAKGRFKTFLLEKYQKLLEEAQTGDLNRESPPSGIASSLGLGLKRVQGRLEFTWTENGWFVTSTTRFAVEDALKVFETLRGKGKKKEARSYFEKIIELIEGNKEPLYTPFRIEKMNEAIRALEELLKAFRRNPQIDKAALLKLTSELLSYYLYLELEHTTQLLSSLRILFESLTTLTPEKSLIWLGTLKTLEDRQGDDQGVKGKIRLAVKKILNWAGNQPPERKLSAYERVLYGLSIIAQRSQFDTMLERLEAFSSDLEGGRALNGDYELTVKTGASLGKDKQEDMTRQAVQEKVRIHSHPRFIKPNGSFHAQAGSLGVTTQIPESVLRYSEEYNRSDSRSVLDVARFAGKVLYLPEANQAVILWYYGQLGLLSEKATVPSSSQAFNQDTRPLLNYLATKVPIGKTKENLQALPLIVSEEVFRIQDALPENTASKLAQAMKPGDLLVAVWGGTQVKPAVIAKLYELSRGIFKVRDVRKEILPHFNFHSMTRSLNAPPLWVSALSEEELELSLREGDRVKLNLELLMKNGIDPIQVLSLLRQLADYPSLRKQLFEVAGLAQSRDGSWELGSSFVALLQAVYNNKEALAIVERAA